MRPIAIFALLATVAVLNAHADEGDEDQLLESGDITTDVFYGRPSSRVPISVPRFHGLEPALAVEISGVAKNGFAGIGGRLAGFSVIEAASPGSGSPRYDGSDVYERDGQPMVDCASLSGTVSPSCVNGGTHAMELESYEKIQLNNGQWTLWSKNGVQRQYRPTHQVSIANVTHTFRWGLSNVIDTKGNTVHYTWSCEGTPTTDCYPSQITYLPAGQTSATVTINIYREARLDSGAFSTGASTLGQTTKRLKTIEVRTGTQLARAYTVTYQTGNGASLLQSVLIYGYDADPYLNKTTGAITSGTTLPKPVTYVWDLPPSALGADNAALGTRSAAPATGSSWFADVNGDGLSDYAYVASSTVHVMLASVPAPNGAAATATYGSDTTWGTQENAAVKSWLVDVTGDGKADFVYLQKASSTYKLWVKASTGSSFSAEGATPWLTLATAPKTTAVPFLSDVNGDGMADFVYTPNGTAIRTALATGSGFSGETVSTASYAPGGKNNETGWVYLVDVDGDGKSDWVYNRTGSLSLYVKRATIPAGGSFQFGVDTLFGTRAHQTLNVTVDSGCTASPTSDSDNGRWVDLNGDGRPDFVYDASTDHVSVSQTKACNSSNSSGCSYGASDPCYPACLSLPTSYDYYCICDGFGGCTSSEGLCNHGGDYCFSHCQSVQGPMCLCSVSSVNVACSATGAGTRQVMISAGTIAASEKSWGTPQGGWLVDMNGDRMADEVYVSAKSVMVALSTGAGFATPTTWGTASQTPASTVFADANGDGKADLVYFYNNELRGLQSTGAMLPLIKEIDNEIGGATRLTYAPSSVWPNATHAPVVPTVLSVAVDDGRGIAGSSVTTTNYAYTGGLYDFISRKFLGFHTATKTLACLGAQTTCPSELTTFAQSYGSYSKPLRIDTFSGATPGSSAVLLTSTQMNYQTNDSQVPYTSLQVGKTDLSYDPAGSGSYKAKSVSWLCGTAPCYDAFGNVTQMVDYGFTDVSGDETTVVYDYVTAPTSYIVGAAAHAASFQGVGTATKLTEGYTFYDGHDDWRTVPTVGLITQSASWLDTADAFTYSTFDYDGYGNRTAVTDANDYTTQTFYDSFYTTFAIEVRNALYDASTPQGKNQHTLTSWEPRCGAPLTTTDGNDQVVTTTYDPLCRVVQVASAGGDGSTHGNVETRTYNMFNGATVTTSMQNVYRTTTAPNASGPGYSYRYIDGRGRTWRTRSAGSSGDVYAQITFDARGNAISTSTPIYWGGTGAFPGTGPTRSVDDLSRPLKVTHTDSSYVTFSYTPTTVTVTDELGHTMTETSDARGRVVIHTEYEGATPRTTQYTYDGRGALATVQDPAGNITRSFVDSLGRPYKIIDPDRGTIQDEYDAMGRVLTHTDALGQVTRFAYDPLGRVTRKTTRLGTPEAVAVSWGYDERYGTGFSNMGHRTSATDPYGTQTEDFNVAGQLAKRTRIFHTVASPTVGAVASLANGDKLIRFIGGSPGQEYDVQASTDLASWTTIGSTAADGSGNFSYEDARHLPIAFYRAMAIGEVGTYSFYFAYDAGGRLKGTRYPDGDVIGLDPLSPSAGTPLAYDNAGQLTSMSALSGGALVSSVSYDALGNATQQVNGNGTSVNRTFDSIRNWLSSITATSGATTLFSLGYSRDTEGKILSLTSDAANESWTYGYDGMHRLTSATNAGNPSDSQSFTYDAIGNMTYNSRIGTYDYRGGGGGCSDAVTSGQPHAVSCAGGVSYKYDASGNMVSGSIGTISYDGSNMPVSAGDYGYTYSADNDRLTVSTSGETTVFLGGSYEISPTGVVTKLLRLWRQAQGRKRELDYLLAALRRARVNPRGHRRERRGAEAHELSALWRDPGAVELARSLARLRRAAVRRQRPHLPARALPRSQARPLHFRRSQQHRWAQPLRLRPQQSRLVRRSFRLRLDAE